ncbi:MAG: TonB-dependent receptor, partial [Novosphingobium sp.]|nr:TonB-dependent receptor [Novosphingobium sp.]
FPLTENGDLRARVAFKLLNRNGYGYDYTAQHDVNNARSQSGRATLQYNPDSTVNIKLTGEYTREKDYNYYVTNFGPYQYGDTSLCLFTDGTSCVLPGVSEFGGIEIRNSQDAASGLDLLGTGHTNQRKGYALTLNANFALSDAITLNSITGWRKFHRYNASNADGSSAGIGNVDYDEHNRQVSQEFVLNYDGGPLQVTAGASYYHEKLDNYVIAPFIQFDNPDTPQLDMPYIQDGTLKINAYAAYLQATYAITPEFRITAAGRYSSEKRTSTGAFSFGATTPIDTGHKWTAFTPKFGIEYDITDGTLFYASYTKGFKSGTYNVGQINPRINPEKIEAYEAGIKSRLFDNRIDLTAAYFHYDYKDLQVNKIIGIGTQTTNAASATTDGFEVAINARVTPEFTLNGNFTYLDSTFSDFESINPLYPSAPAEDLKGKMLPGAPKYAFVIGGQYVLPLNSDGMELAFNADASYQSKVFYSEFNDPQIGRKSATKVNASLKLDTGKNWYVTAWGKNIFDVKTSNNIALGIALWGLPLYGAIDPPATYGATLGVNF